MNSECLCHKESGTNHEQCCGHQDGRNPDCPQHGDGGNAAPQPIQPTWDNMLGPIEESDLMKGKK